MAPSTTAAKPESDGRSPRITHANSIAQIGIV